MVLAADRSNLSYRALAWARADSSNWLGGSLIQVSRYLDSASVKANCACIDACNDRISPMICSKLAAILVSASVMDSKTSARMLFSRIASTTKADHDLYPWRCTSSVTLRSSASESRKLRRDIKPFQVFR